jgi:hypothetical protein
MTRAFTLFGAPRSSLTQLRRARIAQPRRSHRHHEWPVIWRKHHVDVESLSANKTFPVDPYSSGPTFAHWSIAIPPMPDWYHPLPVSPPRTRLLANVGHIDPYETPSALHR